MPTAYTEQLRMGAVLLRKSLMKSISEYIYWKTTWFRTPGGVVSGRAENIVLAYSTETDFQEIFG